MTICLFGNYIPDYPRIEVFRKGLQKCGIKVVECHTREWGLKKYLELWKIHAGLKGQYDILLVCMGGQTLTWFARLLTRRPLAYDAFVSLYVTNVFDRGTCSPQSLAARYYKWIDAFACRFVGIGFLDTQAQIEYFVRTLGVPRGKFKRMVTGADDTIFYPLGSTVPTLGKARFFRGRTTSAAVTPPPSKIGIHSLLDNGNNVPNKFIVHWHGYIVPFHGVETIVRAAKILESHADIQFRLTTRFNRAYHALSNFSTRLGITNIVWFPESDRMSVAEQLRCADVALGVFGGSLKGDLVIPNKIFEAVACRKPVITRDAPSVRELFTPNESIILVKPNDPDDLAAKIIALKRDPPLRERIADRGHEIFRRHASIEAVGKELNQALLSLLFHER